MCITHNFDDEREFVETYLAYSVSHLNGAEPTSQSLLDFERRELMSSQRKSDGTDRCRKSGNDGHGLQSDEMGGEEDEDDIMYAYIDKAPKVIEDELLDSTRKQLHDY